MIRIRSFLFSFFNWNQKWKKKFDLLLENQLPELNDAFEERKTIDCFHRTRLDFVHLGDDYYCCHIFWGHRAAKILSRLKNEKKKKIKWNESKLKINSINWSKGKHHEKILLIFMIQRSKIIWWFRSGWIQSKNHEKNLDSHKRSLWSNDKILLIFMTSKMKDHGDLMI